MWGRLFLSMTLAGPAWGELSVAERVGGRDFPSVFQAWNGAEGLEEPRAVSEARHDLLFTGAASLGLRWAGEHEGLATGFTAESLAEGRRYRAELLGRNPRMVLLCEIRYRDAHGSFLPAESRWWKRDAAGQPVVGWEEGGYLLLDFSRADYRKQVAAQARAAVDSGVFDGVMLDWWEEDEERVALAREVRAAIGEEALILVNSNDREVPGSARYVNGLFMECYRSATAEDWERIERTLGWAEAHLREPRVNCLETWFETSRQDLSRLRATTTLGLAVSDGYVLFGDPNPLPTPDHLHDWYPLWDLPLGRPKGPGAKRPDGSLWREFAGGTVVYNPPGKPLRVSFPEPRKSAATGKVSRTHEIASRDGDVFMGE